MESIPRAVHQYLWPNDAAPSNPTQLANALGVGKTSLRGWYTSMPADRQEQIAVRYGLTSDLRRSWAEDACQKFKELYELHWRPMLTRQGHRVDQLSACLVALSPECPVQVVLLGLEPAGEQGE